MTIQSYLPEIIFVSLLSFFSCTGQVKTAPTPESFAENLLAGPVTRLDEQTWVIFQDSNRDYWFGSNGNGVIKYDGEELQRFTTKDGLVSNTIRGIQEDKEGNLYVETPSGVSKYNGLTFKTLPVVNSAVNAWQLNDDDLWFKCNGNPNDIYRCDGEALYELSLPRKDLNKAFGTKVEGLSFPDMNHSPYSVYGIDKDAAGNLWIGTITAGAFRYDGNSFLWIAEKELGTLPDGRVPGVRSILEDVNGDFWLSNFVNRYRIKENGSSTEYEKLPGLDLDQEPLKDQLPYYNSSISDDEGNLWMAAYSRGVYTFDGSQLKNYQVTDGFQDALVVSIYQDKLGDLWVGTDNVGVLKFDGERFQKFSPFEKNVDH